MRTRRVTAIGGDAGAMLVLLAGVLLRVHGRRAERLPHSGHKDAPGSGRARCRQSACVADICAANICGVKQGGPDTARQAGIQCGKRASGTPIGGRPNVNVSSYTISTTHEFRPRLGSKCCSLILAAPFRPSTFLYPIRAANNTRSFAKLCRRLRSAACWPEPTGSMGARCTYKRATLPAGHSHSSASTMKLALSSQLARPPICPAAANFIYRSRIFRKTHWPGRRITLVNFKYGLAILARGELLLN